MLDQATVAAFPDNVGGSLIQVPDDTPVDNVFTFSSDGKIWKRVFDGGNNIYRASWLFRTGAPTNKAPLINLVVASADIQEFHLDQPIEFDNVDFGNKKIVFSKGGQISGSTIIQNAIIEADLNSQIFTGTPTLTSVIPANGEWSSKWFGANGSGSGNDAAAITRAITAANSNTCKSISFVAGNYVANTNITVPAGVLLDFTKNSYLTGTATISGAGYFDCGNTLTFGGSIVVSGLLYLRNEITPQIFGAVGDDVTSDTAAFQKMWDYIATLTTNVISVFIPARSYYIPAPVLLPKTSLAQNRYISVEGYGAQLRTDTNNPIFSRHPANTSEATVCLDAYKATIKGIQFLGNSTLVPSQTNQIGLDLGAVYSWTIEDCFFYRLYKGIEAQFWLNGKINNCHFTQNYYCDIMGRYGDWTGASRTNSAFNSNTIFGCRFFSGTTAFTTVYLFAADQTLIQECISEGLNPLYNFYMDYDGSTAVNINTYKNIWLESVGGSQAPQNTNFYLKCTGEVHLNNIQREYPNRIFEVAADSAGVIALVMDGIPFFSNLPVSGLTAFSRNGVNNGDWKFIFKNIYTGVSNSLQPPEVASNWDGGTIPTSVSIDTYAPVGGGVTSGIRKSTVLETIAAPNVVFKNTTRAGANYRGLYINAPQTTNGSASATSLLIGNTDLSTPTLPSAAIIGSQRHILWFGQNANANSGTQHAVAYIGNTTDNGRTAISTLVTFRGTLTTPTAVANAVVLGIYRFEGFDGTNAVVSAFLKAIVDGTVSTGIVPTMLEVQVMNASGSLVTPLRFRASGQMEIGVAPTTGDITNYDAVVRNTSTGAVGIVPFSTFVTTTALSASITGNTTVVIPTGRAVFQVVTSSASAQTGLNIGTTPGGSEIDSVTYGTNDGSATITAIYGNGSRSINFSNITGTVTYRILVS